MLIIVMTGYVISGFRFNVGYTLLLAPVMIVQAGLLGLGFGIIVSALTTKYRDLAVLVEFGVQLWMYATPVVYTTEIVPDRFKGIYMLNPMAPLMESWRSSIIGSGEICWGYWGISWLVTIAVLFAGVVLFSRIEKTFMDTV
jgi:lipopolysaccharide transport system permease protein